MKRRGFFGMLAKAVGITALGPHIPIKKLFSWVPRRRKGMHIAEFKYYVRPMDKDYTMMVFHKREP